MNLIEMAKKLRPIIEKAMESVDDETATMAVTLFPKLKEDGNLVSAGTRINWNGIIKKAAVDLWDTVENNPDNAPDLWVDIMYKEGIRIIPENIDATSAFMKEEYGYYNDVLYKSLIDNNVWTPISYPDGWEEINN